MKHIKHFESLSEVDIREKIESIVDMAYYLFDNDMTDTLNNFIGECHTLFMGCSQINRGFTSHKYPKRFYTFDIDCFLKSIDKSYKKEEKLKKIDKLYELSKIKRFKHTTDDIEKILTPIFKIKSYGEDIIESYKIRKYFNSQKKKPGFSIYLIIKDIYYLDKSKVDTLISNYLNIYTKEELKMIKKELKEIENDFYYLKDYITEEIEKLDLEKLGFSFSTCDFTHLREFYKLSIFIEEI